MAVWMKKRGNGRAVVIEGRRGRSLELTFEDYFSNEGKGCIDEFILLI